MITISKLQLYFLFTFIRAFSVINRFHAKLHIAIQRLEPAKGASSWRRNWTYRMSRFDQSWQRDLSRRNKEQVRPYWFPPQSSNIHRKLVWETCLDKRWYCLDKKCEMALQQQQNGFIVVVNRTNSLKRDLKINRDFFERKCEKK